MPRMALAFAYDGARFDSYARQPDRRTVEGELLACLRRGGVVADARSARYATGSRTDKGASAAFNVCAFDADVVPASVPARAVPPDGLWLLAGVRVGDDFNPRHARRRRYRYFLPKDEGGDVARFRRTLALFEGEHDLVGFCRPEPHRPTVRRVARTGVRVRSGFLEASVEGPNFLWQQVRRMVAAAQGAATGRWTPAAVARALEGSGGGRDFGVVPAAGLLLERVDYGFAFPAIPKAVVRDLRAARAAARVRGAVISHALGAVK